MATSNDNIGAIILGNSGVGKSFLGNVILGREAFKHEYQAQAVTMKTEYQESSFNGKIYAIYNIPGLIEAEQERIDLNKHEIDVSFRQHPNAVVVYVFGTNNGRIRNEDIVAFNAINVAYPLSQKSLILVVNSVVPNRPDNYEADTTTILSTLLKMYLPHICFVNQINQPHEKEPLRQQLIQKIMNALPKIHNKVQEINLQAAEISKLTQQIAKFQKQVEKDREKHQLEVAKLKQEFEEKERKLKAEQEEICRKMEDELNKLKTMPALPYSWSGPIYGGSGGSVFTDSNMIGTSYASVPNSINLRSGRLLDAIDMTYQTTDKTIYQAPRRGGSGGTDHRFQLNPDEKIVKITGRAGSLIDALQFTTNTGRTSPFCGGNGGTEFTEQHPGYVLWYISGRSGRFVDQIQFHWVRELTT